MVVLLQHGPNVRFQMLGPVEAHEVKRWEAEAKLFVRSRIIGADAVVNLREERLSGFRRGSTRLAGTAIRAVDQAGRQELISRWFGPQINFAAKSYYVCLIIFLIQNWTQIHIFILYNMSPYIWPLILAISLHRLWWPQLVWPTIISLVAAPLGGLCWLLGALVGWGIGGTLEADHIRALRGLLDPVGWAFLLFQAYIVRTLWRSYSQYRRWASDVGGPVEMRRRIVGPISLVISAVYFLTLVVWLIYEGLISTRLKPDDGEAHYWHGVTLADQERWEEAVAEYREANRLKPDLADAHYWLGNALRAQVKHGEALEAFRTATRLKPDDGDARHWLFGTLADLKKLDEAITAYRKAIRLKPDHPDAHYWLGHALRVQGKRSEAIDAFRTATRLKPDDGEWRYWLGATLADQEMLDEAVAQYREAIRLKFEAAEAHYSLGAALARQGKLEQAIAEYREAIRLKPDLTDAHYWLGAALANQEKRDEAIAEYREAIRLEPDLADAHYWLGRALRTQGEHSEALDAFRTATRLNPDDGERRYWLGVTLAGQEMWEEAIAEYLEAIRLKPDLSDAYHWHGHALQALGKYNEAIDAFRTAIQLNPDDAGAYCDLGSVLALRRDFSGSLAMYRKGHELGSRRPDWRQPSAAWVAEAERLAALEARWPAVRSGRPPRDNEERLFFADLAYHREHFATAARLWTETLAADPKLGDDRRARYRYNAACAAALAATGQATGDAKPDDPARAGLRGQALD